MKRPAVLVGFLGGCLPAQKGIPRSRLFHRILARRFREELRIPVRFAFEDYFRYSECRVGLERLLRAGPPRVLILSLRPQPLLALSKPTIRYVTSEQRPARALHPAIGRRDLAAWRPELDRRDLRHPPGSGPPAGPLRRLTAEWHLAAGRILGLASWATEVVVEEVRRASAECRSRGVQFVVLGIPGSPGSPGSHRICRDADHRVAEACRGAGVCYLRWFATEDPQGTWLFTEDGLHLNEAGHAHVASLLLFALRDRLDAVRTPTAARIVAGHAPSFRARVERGADGGERLGAAETEKQKEPDRGAARSATDGRRGPVNGSNVRAG